MNTLPVSIIILAHQDQPMLKEVIASGKWASEIIVYWTTREEPPAWLSKQPVKLVRTSIHQSDFSALRNDAGSYASEEVIFFVDSDEVIEKDAEKKFLNLLEKSNWIGSSIKRIDIFHDKELHWGEVSNVQILRIFKKNHFHFERPVHERAVVPGNCIESEIVLYHYAHPDMSQFLQSILQYIQLEVKLRQEKNEQVSTISLFAWPTGKFLFNYFLKLGFLDGWRGLIYAICMSFHSFGLRATLYEQQ